MAGHDEGEDIFSDDGLDDLPHDALVELENNAIQFTQAQQASRVKAPPSSDYGDDFEDEDFDDAVVIDESRSTPALNPAHLLGNSIQAAQRKQFQQPRHGTIGHPNSSLANRQKQNTPLPPKFNQTNQKPPPISIPQHESMLAQQGSAPTPDDQVDSLQKQIEELIKERNALKDDLNAKAGEIAIVRSKQEKTVKEYEREMVAVRKLTEDKLAKQQKQLEAAQIREKNAATERDFIAQDLAEESGLVRRLNNAKEAETMHGVGVTTPKKKKALPHRDGFDDNEIEIISPSKISPSKIRRTIGSPAKPGKRKRKAIESPAGALEVTNNEPPIEKPKQMILDEAILKRLAIQDDRFDFIGTLLDHRLDSKHLRTIEELGKYRLPSDPEESFQSIILGKLPSMGYKKPTKDLPIEFCELLISLWSKCLPEKYLAPIYLFVDMLTLALELKTTAIAPHIIETLVPLIQLTIDQKVIPRFLNADALKWMEPIDSSTCLSLLEITALGCMCQQEYIVRFWKLMRFDMIIVILSTNQIILDTELMLRLLSTSVFRDSFGAISSEVEMQGHVTMILDRITYVLAEVPYKPRNTERIDGAVASSLRVQILQLMVGMTRSVFASKMMVAHRDTIGRLVSLMSDELDVLYDYKPGREQSARIISLATRLLYHLVTKYENLFDMQKKLAVVHGGQHRYLLCLARLNFSEDDLVLESGIDPDVAGLALEMLESLVTLEEGDAIQAAFSG